MPDLLPALELACKSVRSAFGAVGALADALRPRAFSEAEASEYLVTAGRDGHGLGDDCTLMTSAASPAAVDDPAGDSSPLPPAGSPEDSFSWRGWALPAIWDVLESHIFIAATNRALPPNAQCVCGEQLWDHLDWRIHVAPLIADRIGCDPARAAAALSTYVPTR